MIIIGTNWFIIKTRSQQNFTLQLVFKLMLYSYCAIVESTSLRICIINQNTTLLKKSMRNALGLVEIFPKWGKLGSYESF